MKARVLSVGLFAVTVVVCYGAEKVPEGLIRDLASEEFKEREEAEGGLLDWAASHGVEAVRSIHVLSIGSDNPEIRQRCLKILKDLSDRDYLSSGSGYLGITMLEERMAVKGDDKPRLGIRIQWVVDGSPASEAGIRRGDLIVALDGKKWHDDGAMDDFREIIADSKPLENVVLSIIRGDEDPFDASVRLGRRPIENLSGIGQDLQLLDQRAREAHFKEWLKKVKKGD